MSRERKPGAARHLPVVSVPSQPELVPPPVDTKACADELMRVGDVARATGKTVRAIHHYEELGLVRPNARSKGRFRLYDESAIARVRWIGKMHELGLSLAQIQTVLGSWESAENAPSAMAEIRAVYTERLRETRSQIQRLAALERELEASIGYLATCKRCDPDEIVDACSDCHVHEETEEAPSLVAEITG